MSKDIIVGLHSIGAALESSIRTNKKLFFTKESLKDFVKVYPEYKSMPATIKTIELGSPHDLQQQAEKLFRENNFKFSRVPGNIFCEVDPLPFLNIGSLFDRIKSGSGLKILCLDQVTDSHNAAAIIRTAAFYGVDAIVLPGKNSSGFSPNFFRIASGGSEHLKIYKISNLSKFISRSQELEAICVGFSEHSSDDAAGIETKGKNVVLVLGNEEKGISHAVMRQLKSFYALKGNGKIKSLNVSVACAVAMEKFFGIN